jgi:hypothetical protein
MPHKTSLKIIVDTRVKCGIMRLMRERKKYNYIRAEYSQSRFARLEKLARMEGRPVAKEAALIFDAGLDAYERQVEAEKGKPA